MIFRKLLIVVISLLLLFSLAGCSSNTEGQSGISSPFIGYTVTYETNGAERIRSEKLIELSNPPSPYRFGYEFEGWYLDRQLSQSAVFPIKLKNDITLYAKWLKTGDVKKISDFSIKLSAKTSSLESYDVTPRGFDVDRLNQLDRDMTITVTYTVYYAKDYDVLWDIGYMGSPKYEIYLVGSSLSGNCDLSVNTSKSPEERTISMRIPANYLRDEKITLTFSTDNIQNIIYFEDIVVTYDCSN